MIPRTLTLDQAIKAADFIKATLAPHCTRIEIAGSVRRGKLEGIKDIEIVCTPKEAPDPSNLFGDTVRSFEFVKAVRSLGTVVRKVPNTEEYGPAKTDLFNGRQIQVIGRAGILLDLYIAPEDNFGLIYLIRTGPADGQKGFAARMLATMNKWGYKKVDNKKKPGGYRIHPKTGEYIGFKTEAEVFQFLKMEYVEPRDRK